MLRMLIILLSLISSSLSFAHGSMDTPISRIYTCYKEGPENVQSPACKAFVAMSGKQPLYDWDMINISQANDQHRQLIPDGTLCAAGRDKYAGMNITGTNWLTTPIKADSAGNFTFIWRATVPHATKYFQFFITKENYDFSQPLKWSDIGEQPFCTITNVTLDNGFYKMLCPLPKGAGRRIIYTIWQRIDSPEAFYSCSDVILTGPSTSLWNEVGNLRGYSDQVPNTKIVFWLMSNCSVIENFTVQLQAGQNQANQWPFYLAQQINANSSFVNIGQLNAQTNTVTPVLSATLNNVYVKDPNPNQYYFIIDIIRPNAPIKFANFERMKRLCQSSS